MAKFLARKFIFGGSQRRPRHPIPDHHRDGALGWHHLPVGPEEGAAAEFGGGAIRRADPDAAGVEPLRQLVGEGRGAEAVVTTKEDDGSAASGH